MYFRYYPCCFGAGREAAQAAFAFFMKPKPKTNVYIDGFNLYFGALKGTPYRWLDVATMCRLLLPHNDIHEIKYCTALVTPRPGHEKQPIRQQTYLRALKTIPNLSITLGHFLTHEVMMPLATPQNKKVQMEHSISRYRGKKCNSPFL